MNLTNKIEASSNETKATIRTTYNTSLLFYIILILNWAFGLSLSLDDPVLIGAAIPVIAIFNRGSRLIAVKFPSVGWVLFGYGEEPRY